MLGLREFKIVQYRLVFIVGAQLALATLSLILSFLLRYDILGVTTHVDDFVRVLPIFLAVKLVVFYFFDLYRGWWRYAGMSDLLDIIKASAVSLVPIYFVVTFASGAMGFSRTIFLIDAILSVALIGGVRFVIRLYTESIAAQAAPTGRNLIIVGAGNTGRLMVREIKQNPNIDLVPVGFLDDDPRKRGAKVEGVRVLGRVADLPRFARELKVREVLLALPSASGEEMSRAVRVCQEAGVAYKTVPAIGDLINGRLSLSQVREVKIEDLLGRQVVDIDTDVIHRNFASKVVLITGAGGSIGSELARQVAGFGPSRLILYERSENDLFHIERELRASFPHLALIAAAGDILDTGRLEEIFFTFRPAAVLHAAAYKHVPMMESQPFMAIRNNVLGTYNVASISARYGIESFLLISTDKAVNPTNVMGVTKRIAELVALSFSGSGRTRFSAVRFGNVLGSNGSVVPLFKAQIAARQPVTVTDPEVTRYFMTIPEAVRLVLQASTMGDGGDVFILDMGRPVKIVDLARNLIRLSGLEPDHDIKIVFTGLRPGEKRFEELLVATEGIERTSHPQVFQLRGDVPSPDAVSVYLDVLGRVADARDVRGLVSTLREIVPEYTPSRELLELAKVRTGSLLSRLERTKERGDATSVSFAPEGFEP
jgi:FlaA1/EpsC-like NDP-sugar epimerase